MGEDKEHSRFTLVAAGGAKSRGWRSARPRARWHRRSSGPHDIALRLERNRWNGMVEPRVILRALCPTEPGELRRARRGRALLGRAARDARRRRAPAAAPRPPRAGIVEDRRGEGFAGVAGDLFSSGERVLVAVADVPRRRAGLEAVVAGLSDGPMPVTSWGALAAQPALAEGFDHLVALDPPPGGIADPLLRTAPRAHLAWGPAEAEFAITRLRAPSSTCARSSPRSTAPSASCRRTPPRDDLEAALRGNGRYPRSARACARLARVLTELGLIELDTDARTCRVLDAARSDLELLAEPTARPRASWPPTERALAARAARAR